MMPIKNPSQPSHKHYNSLIKVIVSQLDLAYRHYKFFLAKDLQYSKAKYIDKVIVSRFFFSL